MRIRRVDTIATNMANTLCIEREISQCTCSRCGRVMDKDSGDMEWQERFVISFRGGMGSNFGDGALVEGIFCQSCIEALLGKWLRISPDDPFNPVQKATNDAEKFLQPYQERNQADQQRLQSAIADRFLAGRELWERRRQLVERHQDSEKGGVSSSVRESLNPPILGDAE